MNNNGFSDVQKRLGKMSNVNQTVTLEVLEEAAIFFAAKLAPNIPLSVRNSKHLRNAIKVEIKENKVVVFFDSNNFYWRFVDHGSTKQKAQNFVRGTYIQNKSKIEEIMLRKIVEKMEG
ncbi:hypothetical protein A0221_12790 [Listeria monocytogenes]|nr:hypothetical protein [Listeria monocytogenes]